MKINKTIEVVVCDHCGKELEKYHLEIIMYDYQPYEDNPENTDRYNLHPRGTSWVMELFTHGTTLINTNDNYTLSEHELLSDFCDWQCFVEYVKGDKPNALPETQETNTM